MPVSELFFILFMVAFWALLFVGLVQVGTRIAYKTLKAEQAKDKLKEKKNSKK